MTKQAEVLPENHGYAAITMITLALCLVTAFTGADPRIWLSWLIAALVSWRRHWLIYHCHFWTT